MSEWGPDARTEHCANCSVTLHHGGNSAKSILSTWEGDTGRSPSVPISIYEALSVIFEMGPLHPAGSDDMSKKDLYKTSRSKFRGDEGEGGRGGCGYYGLCRNCSETLATLYNAFQEFTSTCKWGSQIGRILRELEGVKTNGGKVGVGGSSDSGNPAVKLEPPEEVEGMHTDEEDEDEETATTDFEPGGGVIKQPPESPPEDGGQSPASPYGSDNSDDGSQQGSNSKGRNPPPKKPQSTPRGGFLQCRKCKKQFLFETTLICHRRIIHQENIASVPPPISVPQNRNSLASSLTNTSGGEETSTCPICRLVVLRKNIREHLSTHTRSHLKPWMCLVCGKEFRNQMELFGHAATHKKTIPCRNCGKTIPRLGMLAHIRLCFPSRMRLNVNPIVGEPDNLSSGSNRWSCKLCGINFARKDWMVRHMATHMQAKRHMCKICDRRFDRPDLLRLHVKRFHRNNEGPPSVRPPTTAAGMMDMDDNDNVSLPDAPEPSPPSTSNPFSSKDKQENATDQAVIEKRFVCTECQLDFLKYSELEAHLMAAHADRETFTCTICKRKLQDTFCLTLHLKSHSETKPFICYICGKPYREKINFFYHLKDKHSLEESAIVDKYPYVFRAKSKYAKRKRVLVGEQLVKVQPRRGEFPCEVCGKVFPFMHAVNKHKRAVHEQIRDFICSYCGKSFARKSYFLIHEKLHTSTETPYKCHLCGKGFRLPGNLRSHLQSTIHNSERNFVCDTCGKAFNRRDNLRLHVRCVHMKIPMKKSRGGGESRYTRGGRRRVYGADLPFPPDPLSQSPETSSSLQNLPSSSTTAEEQQHQNQLGFTSAVPVIIHPQGQQQNPSTSFSHADFSTIQHSQLGFNFPSYHRR